MRFRPLAVRVGLLGALLASAPEAIAQSAPTSSPPSTSYPAVCSAANVPQAETDRAHTVYAAGKIQYDDRNYDGAIAQFREAYKRDCSKHELLVIISRAYDLKGDKVEALRALELYVERVPGSPDAATHRSNIENLKKQIAVQKPAAQPSSTAAEPAEGVPPVRPPSDDVREHTVGPWIVVGAGGAVALVGLILLVGAPDTKCDLPSETCTRNPGESDPDLAGRQKAAGKERDWGRWGPILLVSGGVIAVGGFFWHFLEPTGRATPSVARRKSPTLTPEAAVGYGGLSLRGNF